MADKETKASLTVVTKAVAAVDVKSATSAAVDVKSAGSNAAAGTGKGEKKASSVKRKVTVCGHRGAGILVEENTMKAFEHAIKIGVEWMETDLWITKDKVIILSHIEPDNHTSSAQSAKTNTEKVTSMTHEEVLKLNKNIPTLQQLFEAMKGSKVGAVLELKGVAWANKENMQILLAIIEQYQYFPRIKISSFDHDNFTTLYELKKEKPPPICLLFNRGGFALPDNLLETAKKFKASEIHCRYNFVTSKIVQDIQKAGMKCMAWFGGAQDEGTEELQQVINTGVDIICTNRPDRLINMLAA